MLQNCVVDEHRKVLEYFRTRKEARSFSRDWTTVERRPARVMTLDHQPQIGDTV
jgi:hypothetical protein